MCFTSPSLSLPSPSHFTSQPSQKDSQFDRNTSFSACPLRVCTTERIKAVFARGGGFDAPLLFDCPVSKGEQVLLSDGEWGYLMGIVAVPVLSSVASVERVQHTVPMSIDARQVNNPVEDD